jgi:hypothetical protein
VWTRVREYSHRSPPDVVWELTLRAPMNDVGLGWNPFGAKRFGSFPPVQEQGAGQNDLSHYYV